MHHCTVFHGHATLSTVLARRFVGGLCSAIYCSESDKDLTGFDTSNGVSDIHLMLR